MRFPLPTLVSKFSSLLAGSLLLGSSSVTSLAINWNFSASDGFDTISGTMATTGTLLDLASPGSFQIQAILTLELNGSPPLLVLDVPWTDEVNADIANSPLVWSGSGVELPIFISAISSGGDNLEIDINPALGGLRARIEGLVEFIPSTYSVTPIGSIPAAVPDSGSSAGLMAVALAGLACWRRRHAAGE